MRHGLPVRGTEPQVSGCATPNASGPSSRGCDSPFPGKNAAFPEEPARAAVLSARCSARFRRSYVIFLYIYLLNLFIAPQDWLEPFKGLPVDYIVYPCWLLFALATGRLLKIRFHLAEVFFAAFIFWVVLSNVMNGTTENIVPIALSQYVKWLVLFILIRSTVTNVQDLRRAGACMVLLVYVLVIEGIQQKHDPAGLNWAGGGLGWVDAEVLAAGGTGRTQWVGVFEGMGVFCVAYTAALPYVLQYTTSTFKPAVRWLNRLGLPFLLVAIYYTGSRGGFLATLALIGLHIAVVRKVSARSILIAATAATVAFTVAPSSLTQTKDSEGSAQNRVDVWAQGLGFVIDSPVWGVGRGNFAERTGSLIAHNSGMQIMAETGLIGMFLWVSLIAVSLRAAYVRYQLSLEPSDRRVIAATMASVVGYLVSSFFVTLEYETFYMLLALCAALATPVTQPLLYRRKEFMICCGIVVVFLLAIKGIVMVY